MDNFRGSFFRRKRVALLSVVPLGLLALGLNLNSQDRSLAMVAEGEGITTAQSQPLPTATPASKKTANKFLQDYDFSSGPRTTSELDQEWHLWTSSAEAINLADLEINEPMRLTGILTEFQDLSKNPLRILHIVSLNNELTHKPDTVTLYNRQIDGLEEKNLKIALVVPHRLVPSKKGLIEAMTDKSFYSVSMDQSILKRPFDVRPASAVGEFAVATETDFQPLVSFLQNLIDEASFEAEVEFADVTYSVQAEARETEFGSLIIELQLRALDSLQTQKIALIYE